MICPSCGAENLEGADDCEACQAPLTNAGELAPPPTGWHKKIMNDAIKKVGIREPIIVKPETSLQQAVKQMKEHKIGCGLVVENNELVGIFTERDVLQKAAKPNLDLSDIDVEQIMTPSPEVLHDTDTIAFALNKMAMGNYRHVPVQREDGSVYILSVLDVLRYVF